MLGAETSSSGRHALAQDHVKSDCMTTTQISETTPFPTGVPKSTAKGHEASRFCFSKQSEDFKAQHATVEEASYVRWFAAGKSQLLLAPTGSGAAPASTGVQPPIQPAKVEPSHGPSRSGSTATGGKCAKTSKDEAVPEQYARPRLLSGMEPLSQDEEEVGAHYKRHAASAGERCYVHHALQRHTHRTLVQAAAQAAGNKLREEQAKRKALEDRQGTFQLKEAKVRRSALGSSGAAYMPWSQYALAGGLAQGGKVKSSSKPIGACSQPTLAIPAWDPPIGWQPKVYNLEEPRELGKRALEALRIAPMLHQSSIEHMLDSTEEEMQGWPPGQREHVILNAICAVAGHSRLASMRCRLVSLDAYLVANFAKPKLSVMSTGASAIQLKEWAASLHEALELKKKLSKARKQKLGSADNHEQEEDESGAGASSSALSSIGSATRAMKLAISIDHALLDQLKSRPTPREGGGAVPPELLLEAHYELGAADVSHSAIVRGCMALAALACKVCTRQALGKRSLRPRRTANGMAVGASGQDLKKRQWRSAKRPLLCSVHGATGDDTFFTIACNVLDEGNFNESSRSLLRAHNGAQGNPANATEWLDRPPTDAEWNTCLRYLQSCDVHMKAADGGAAIKVSPHLLKDELGNILDNTSHSLKMYKISLYHALLLHTDYIVEPGAHAGSQIERMSVAAAAEKARNIRPTGLHTALHYARGARAQTVLEVEHMVYEALRSFIGEVGLMDIPRRGGWAALTAWSTSRLVEKSGAPKALLPMVLSRPERLGAPSGYQSDGEGEGAGEGA